MNYLTFVNYIPKLRLISITHLSVHVRIFDGQKTNYTFFNAVWGMIDHIMYRDAAKRRCKNIGPSAKVLLFSSLPKLKRKVFCFCNNEVIFSVTGS